MSRQEKKNKKHTPYFFLLRRVMQHRLVNKFKKRKYLNLVHTTRDWINIHQVHS